MLGPLKRGPLLATVWLGALTLGACERRDRAEVTGEAPAGADTRVSPVPAPDSVPAGDQLSDANIVALLDEANEADSAAGAFARDRARDPGVKDFARLMMGEHHALRMEGRQLARQLNITPEPPANDPVRSLAESEMAALRAAAKGAEFDRTYIEQEVAAHKAVLDLAEKAHETTQNGQLKALIEKAKPVIQNHLDRAERLQAKLGEAAA